MILISLLVFNIIIGSSATLPCAFLPPHNNNNNNNNKPNPHLHSSTSPINGESSPSPSLSSLLPTTPPNTHRIILMRHGESEFNNANVFTGWCDVALTPRGVVEAVEAGQVFRSRSIHFRKCYTSVLTRSIATAQRALEAAGVAFTPLVYDWRLNERHYGALQGLSKERTAERLGRERVMKWRRSYEAKPPLMMEGHPHYDMIMKDARYRRLSGGDAAAIPLGESLEDCQLRVLEAWNDLLADIPSTSQEEEGYTLLVAHANTLRALVMHLDDIPSGEIESLNIPTAIPFYYDICRDTGKVVQTQQHATNTAKGKFRGVYIDDDQKRRGFLERRRAANDPWLWALHDDQVAPSMLVGNDDDDGDKVKSDTVEDDEGLVGLEEEVARNTALFSSVKKAIKK